MRHLNKILSLIIICFSISYSNAQSNDNINLQLFKKEDYDILNRGNLFSKIDFYNANEITLYRELRGDEVTATNGVLKIINNVRYEYIILPKRNVGRFYSTDSYYDLRVSFDARDPQKSIKFIMMKSTDGDNLFYLNTIIKDNQVAVSYAGKIYFVLVGSGYSKDGGNYVYLLYDNITETNKTTEIDTLKSFTSRRRN